MRSSLHEIAARLMRCPAAPYHESIVAGEAAQICRENELPFELDPFGNILVRLNRSSRSAPFVLAAHLDHPAFVIRRRMSAHSWRAEFLGGVGDDYFKPGVKLRLFPGGLAAELGERLGRKRRVFELIGPSASEKRPEFAVWDLPEFILQEGRITGRACDDLIGAATILHALSELRRSKARVNVIGVLSRAEEVGFHGALALAKSKGLPSDSIVVSLETSRELPPAQMGHGVIIRVGDRTSIFDSAASRFLTETASDVGKESSWFKFQRALMSGGTCEATAYQELGYRCAAVCVALGNYHNCAANREIQAEFVSLFDAETMSLLLQTCAREMRNYDKTVARLPRRLAGFTQSAVRELKRKPLTIT